MNDIIYLDSYAWVGRRGHQDSLEKWTTEDLLSEMEHCGIHGTLVSHYLAYIYAPMYGNNLLTKELKKSNRLYGMWIVTPPGCSDMPSTKKLIHLIKENNIRAIKLAPYKHNFSLSEVHCIEMIKVLVENEMPIFIEYEEADALIFFEEIKKVVQQFPCAKIVIHGARWSKARGLWLLLKSCDNIMVDFSNFQMNYLIEEFIKEFGDRRLLFGTQALIKSPGAAKAFLDYSKITKEQKTRIASGNLKDLLRVSEIPDGYAPGKDAPMLKKVKAGEPLSDTEVIDSHAHILHEGGMGDGNYLMFNGDADGIVNRNQRMGIKKTCVSSWLGIRCDTEKGNEITLKAMKKYSDHFIGYICIDPSIGDTGEQVEKWRKCGFKGIKPYPAILKCPYDSPSLEPAWEVAEKYHMFVLLHQPHENFKKSVLSLATRYKNISWLIAHSASSFESARSTVDIAKKRKNVYLEITYTSVPLGTIEYIVNQIGEKRLLFGTDQPMRDPIPQFGWLMYSRLTDSQKEYVLGKNMARILKETKK